MALTDAIFDGSENEFLARLLLIILLTLKSNTRTANLIPFPGIMSGTVAFLVLIFLMILLVFPTFSREVYILRHWRILFIPFNPISPVQFPHLTLYYMCYRLKTFFVSLCICFEHSLKIGGRFYGMLFFFAEVFAVKSCYRIDISSKNNLTYFNFGL